MPTMRWLAAVLIVLFAAGRAAPGAAAGDRELVCGQVPQPPVIDGTIEEGTWGAAPALTTRDPIAEIDITLRAVCTAEEIFLLIEFPDPTESREHRTQVWDSAAKHYVTGPRREDIFVVKWSMEPYPVDLTLHGDAPYQADIWYWKAHRTDPAGYADDKVQVYSSSPLPDSIPLISQAGKEFHLIRNGDDGTSAYQTLVLESFSGDNQDRYVIRVPAGSRADVHAKGHWAAGKWTVEMGRARDTGHPDDIQFDQAGRYQFGVSRFEIAGRPPTPDTEEPKFGSGEITEDLWLRID